MENKISKSNLAIIQAFNKGYRVINGIVFYKGNIVKNNKGCMYYYFSVRMYDGCMCKINVHRFVAYQKFGNKIFDTSLQVRHLDSDETNNKEYNIGIGTPTENQMDKSPELRMSIAVNASRYIKKYNHEEILLLHKNGFSYKKIMEKLGINSKGTISFIVNKSMSSKI